jgi:hypothetical protein
MIKRREFITLIGGAAVGVSRTAHAQGVPVIGMLLTGSWASSAPFLDEFHGGLGELGYVEGRNVAIEYGWTEDRHERFRELADELSRLGSECDRGKRQPGGGCRKSGDRDYSHRLLCRSGPGSIRLRR